MYYIFVLEMHSDFWHYFFYTDPTILEYGDILNSYFMNEIIVKNRAGKLRDCCKIPERNLNWSGGGVASVIKMIEILITFVMTMEALFSVLAFCGICDFNLEEWTEGHCGYLWKKTTARNVYTGRIPNGHDSKNTLWSKLP